MAVSSMPVPAGVVPSGRYTVPDSSPAIVDTPLLSARSRISSWLVSVSAPLREVGLGKKIWLAVTVTGPTFTPTKR